MPSYFYHLKFELYRGPLSDSGIEEEGRYSRQGTVWLPSKNSSIFDKLPSHPRDPSTSILPCDRPRKPPTRPREPPSTPRPSADSSVIDCGALRPTEIHDERNIVILSEAQHRRPTSHLPLPQHSAALNPQIAAKDWRFGRISVESIDMDGHASDDAVRGMPSTAAATVGPSMGTAGKAAKAMYLPLATANNTNIGWGIVHLYREGNETPELHLPPQEDLQGEHSQAQLDCTTVCIPAVPSYLSPSDFLGFIGDKWRGQISHFRMVMTGRMNRYLVLMKFRDSKKAQFFQQEFDGRVFNHIEVWPAPKSL